MGRSSLTSWWPKSMWRENAQFGSVSMRPTERPPAMNKTTNDTSVKRDSAFNLAERGVDDLRGAVALQLRVRGRLQRLDA